MAQSLTGSIIGSPDHVRLEEANLVPLREAQWRGAKFQTSGTPKPPSHRNGIGQAWKHSSSLSSASAMLTLASLWLLTVMREKIEHNPNGSGNGNDF
jgi:hypothetical protein